MNSTEIWKTIPEWPNYAISNRGRVKRLFPLTRLLACGCNGYGYPQVWLYRGHGTQQQTKRFLVHHLVLRAFSRAPRPHEMCNHRDSQRSNNNASNLEWVTSHNNSLHAVANGKIPHGDHHWSRRHPEWVARGHHQGFALLNERQVRQIRTRYANEHARHGCGAELARQYHVHPNTIYQILHHRAWNHVT